MYSKIYNLKEAKLRIEKYCAKQDRCQKQVLDKLRIYGLSDVVIEEFLIDLISNNFVNEERYSRSFCRGKFKIKKWGRRKITFELKRKNVSDICIAKGLEEIEDVEYLETLNDLLNKKKVLLKETNPFIIDKKVADYLIGKGYESELVWNAIRQR